MKAISALLIALLLVTPALAQNENGDWANLTREQTFERISETLAQINEPFANSSMYASDKDWVQEVIAAGIRQVAQLRDYLAGNGYVEIRSFSVGIPWGVTVEFEFPPEPTTAMQ